MSVSVQAESKQNADSRLFSVRSAAGFKPQAIRLRCMNLKGANQQLCLHTAFLSKIYCAFL